MVRCASGILQRAQRSLAFSYVATLPNRIPESQVLYALLHGYKTAGILRV